MEAQHHVIQEAAEAVDRLLPVWHSTDRDGAALARLQAVLVERMALEERELLPLAKRYITAREWRKLAGHSLNETPKKNLPLELAQRLLTPSWRRLPYDAPHVAGSAAPPVGEAAPVTPQQR